MEPADTDPISPTTPPIGSLDRTGDSIAVPQGSTRLWILVLTAGMMAGVVAGVAGEICASFFRPPRHAVNSKGVVLQVTDRREEAATDAKNAGLAFVILGAALGASLGAAGGLLRDSNRAAGWAAVLGLTVGALGAAGAAAVVLPIFNSYKLRHPDEASASLILPLLVQAGVCSVIGAAGGLAFGRGLGGRGVPAHAILGGITGAVIAAATYELIGAITIPGADTTRFIAEDRQTRVLAKLAVSLFVAAGVGLSVNPRPRSASPED